MNAGKSSLLYLNGRYGTVTDSSLFYRKIALRIRCSFSPATTADIVPVSTSPPVVLWPLLPGEEDGEWLSAQHMVKKRVDVVIRDVAKLDNIDKLIPSIGARAAENRTGYIFLERRYTHEDLRTLRIQVHGIEVASKAKRKPKVPKVLKIGAPAIRPLREDIKLAFGKRVLVLGLDWDGRCPERIGKYAQVQIRGLDCERGVSVMFEDGELGRYAPHHLVLSENKEHQGEYMKFHATNFQNAGPSSRAC
ncbi:hypothetical protein FB45DRAFT_1022959 [Roridomyces roridus]|uniref:Uncharacterized protein n=1 Tax=Roridomyces roridus TaxID=1738132 RepID=A0AAD7C9H4_9AGAR|nr:hypothetical protein FB45DRAFT_1022959 [Roridomyces roridus]